jgi:RNA polymerase sigma-70 factor (ECF subfamily)
LRNVVIDLARARRVRPPVAAGDSGAERPADDELERAVTAWQVEAALAELDDDHRRVLVEVHWRGRPYLVVAEDLGIPTGTVKSRVYYGLRALRSSLEAQGWRDA